MGWTAAAVAAGLSVAVVVLKLLQALDVVPLVSWLVTSFTAVFLALAAVLIRLGLYPDDPDPLARFVATVNEGVMRVVHGTVGRARGHEPPR